MRNVYVGHTAEGERVFLDLELTSKPTTAPHQTTDHKPADTVLELTMSVATWQGGREARGGQALDALREVGAPGGSPDGPYNRDQIARLVTLWKQHHLNGLQAGCVHQGDRWLCTGAPDGPHGQESIENGWSVIHALFGPYPYPRRGDICHACGRNRWDEPSDKCPASGYRFGTAWLSYAIPAVDLAELRTLEAVGAARST